MPMYDKIFDDDLRADRRLSPEQRSEIQRVLRAVMMPEDVESDLYMVAETDIEKIEEITIERGSDDLITITAFRAHQEEETISVAEQEMEDCTREHNHAESTTTLEDVDPDLAYDLASLIAKMAGLRRDQAETGSRCIGDFEFPAISCLEGVTEFPFMVEPDGSVYELYHLQKTTVASRLGIPVEPTEEERKY
jgi:hypothetical protein